MAGIACPQCGAENPKTNRFCDTCGAKMAASAVADDGKPGKAKAAAAPAAKRRVEEEAEPALLRANGQVLGLDVHVLWMTVVVLFGAFLRLWQLGAKPLHHDESIHAFYAWQLFKGDLYKYDPAYHGPFRYHMNALMFFLFGDSDFTTRLLPAILGITTLAFLWQWRGLLGRKGAIFAAAMVAISPTWCYTARFIRDDATMALGSLLMVWGVFRYFETHSPKHFFWAVVGLMIGFTSHEGTWIIMGIFGSFLAIRWLWERFEKVDGDFLDVTTLVSHLAPPLKAPGADVAGGVAAVVVLAFGLGSKAWAGMGFGGVLLGLVISYAVTALSARLLFFTDERGRFLWRGAYAICFIPFSLLFSTGFTNMDGWFTGAFDSIAYWLGEQKTGRADQPWQFYLYML
ncbi:MAG TPA: flippase activity-associated protein Agl23, partial [bacterium]|nr:flippase activity-associated protein Agl23 [bacterium]